VAQARSIVENAERPLKKIRREQESTKTASGGSNSNSLLSSKVDKSQPSSIKKDDETPFPRGGASVLTPLEHKQIQIEATRDALFEQQNASKDEPNESKRKDSSKLKKKKNKSGNAREESKPEEDLVKIEGLSYKVFASSRLHPCDVLTEKASCSWLPSPRTGLSNQPVRYRPSASE
jgi:rRNA biogenesis protein RRP5